VEKDCHGAVPALSAGEDDPALLELLRALCASASAELTETGDGLEARQLAASLWPDVILTAGPRPGAEWLRTLPQRWHEIPGAGAAGSYRRRCARSR
jgi:CheY-like chemotaxis protein